MTPERLAEIEKLIRRPVEFRPRGASNAIRDLLRTLKRVHLMADLQGEPTTTQHGQGYAQAMAEIMEVFKS